MRKVGEILHDIIQSLRDLGKALDSDPEPPPVVTRYHRAPPFRPKPLPPPPGYASWRAWVEAGCPEWWDNGA